MAIPEPDDPLNSSVFVDTLAELVTAPNAAASAAVAVGVPWHHGRAGVLRPLQWRLEPWSRDRADPPESLRLVPLTATGLTNPSGQGGEVRTRLTRWWAWRRLGRVSRYQLPEYSIRPIMGESASTIAVWLDTAMPGSAGLDFSSLGRHVLAQITDRLPRPERDRLWFDLNVVRTDRAAARRRIVRSLAPKSLPGISLLFVTGVAVAFTLARRLLASPVALTVTDVAAVLGIVATTVGLVLQIRGGRGEDIRDIADGAGFTGPLVMRVIDGWDRPRTDATLERDFEAVFADVSTVMNLMEGMSVILLVTGLERGTPEGIVRALTAIADLRAAGGGRLHVVAEFEPAIFAAQVARNARGQETREDAELADYLSHLGWRVIDETFDLFVRLGRMLDGGRDLFLQQVVRASLESIAAPDRREVATAGPDTKALTIENQPTGAADADETHSYRTLVAAVSTIADLGSVRTAIEASIARLPYPGYHQVRAFINLWQFYLSLELQTYARTPEANSLAGVGLEFVRLTEMSMRWPSALKSLSTADNTGRAAIASLVEARDDDARWQQAASAAGFVQYGLKADELRVFLRRDGCDGVLFADIATRYL